MTLTALAAIGLAFSLDLLIGEPPNAAHPVAWFGRAVSYLDREWSDDERGQRYVGVVIAVAAPLVAAALAYGAVLAATAVATILGAVLAACFLFLTVSLRALLDLTRAVVDASADDVGVARERLRGLAGRDASLLSPAEIRSAAVESAGENLADGLAATLLPFALLAPVSLPVAAGVAAWVKCVNTLDSMLGYPSKPIGTASARLDDVVMWVPARVSALALAAAAVDPPALWRAREWAMEPPSPNSGWPMATLACALGVRLEKPGVYVLNPDADPPSVEDGARAVTVVGRAAVVLVALAAVLAALSPAVAAELAQLVGALERTGAAVVRWWTEFFGRGIESFRRSAESVRGAIEGVVR